MAENSVQCVSGRCDPTENCPIGEGEVSIECLQSSEFVIGKQANFNGAVTIINCADAPKREGSEGKSGEEKIIIKDKVMTRTASTQGVTGKKLKFADARQKLVKWRIEHKKVAIISITMTICVGFLAMVAIGLVVLLPKESSTGRNVTDTQSDCHPFYSKEDWQGRPPKSIVKMKLPIPYVVVSHTVTTFCYSFKACAALIRNMQDYHFTLEFADIGYNFLVDSRGNIYEGRGWDRRNVKGGFVNGRNIDIGLIGDYSEAIQPTQELMDGLKHLLDFGLAHGKISHNYSLIAANSTYSTLSPGKNVYNIIKDWPHFDPNPKAHIKEFEE